MPGETIHLSGSGHLPLLLFNWVKSKGCTREAVLLIQTCPVLESNDWCGGEKGQQWMWIALMASHLSRSP